MSGHSGPEYQRAADQVKTLITAGRITGILKIREIAGLTGTTYSTARRTAEELEAEGILRAHQGKGYEIAATPEEASAQRADAKELARQVTELRDELQALSARADAADERLERINAGLEDLHDKLGYEYAADGTSERGEQPAAAARRGRTG